MKNIAVIGGGIFGCSIAVELAKEGHKVTLFEKLPEILSGATTNSTNRLHLGLHYPRDLKTASQSKIGFADFEGRFPETVRRDFPNYYGIAKTNSKVSAEEFEWSALRSENSLFRVSLDEIADYGIATEEILRAWRCEEAVIDFPILQKILSRELQENDITLRVRCEILEVRHDNNGWTLVDGSEQSEAFEVVFRATYGSDRIGSTSAAVHRRHYEYHKTIVLEVESSTPTFGMTVVDGDFMTILPQGFSDRFLIYAPTKSVMAVATGNQYPNSWDIEGTFDERNAVEDLIQRTRQWAPGFDLRKVSAVLYAIRSIEANVKKTDRRVSSITELDHNFFDVLSGKIDHCVAIGHQAKVLSK